MSHNMPPRAAMACTSYPISSNQIGIRVLCVNADHVADEKFDGKDWQKEKIGVECVPGTEIAAISWGSGNSVQMRVYFQKGEHVSAISEWMWSQGKWSSGELALPPA